MTRSELVAALTGRFPSLVAADAELAVREVLAAMSRTLSEGGRIEIRGFGAFAVNYRPARTGRNPASGETVPIPAKYAPHFKPGKELRERVLVRADGRIMKYFVGPDVISHETR